MFLSFGAIPDAGLRLAAAPGVRPRTVTSRVRSASARNLPASVQIIAFRVGLRAHEILLGLLHILSRWEAGQWNVSIFGWLVYTRCLVMYRQVGFHSRPQCYATFL
jgi:hypothetical protein